MYKNPDTGFWEEDFRRKGLPRLHLSYGVKKKEDALPASAAMNRVYREKRRDVIDKVKSGELTAFEIAGVIADDKPLGSLVGEADASSAATWPLVKDAVDEYVRWLTQSDKRAERTAINARTQINHFIKFVDATLRVDEITAAMVVAFQQSLYEKKLAQNTIVGVMWRVSGLYTWLQRREKREARDEKRLPRLLPSPLDPEETTSRTTKRDRWLTEPEAERLLAATPPALLAAIMLGLFAGLRVDEMLHLRPQYDVDLKLGLITIQEQPNWHPKNRKRRVVPIAPQLKPVLEYHIARYASEQWLFVSTVYDDRPLSKQSFYDHLQRVVKNAELFAGNKRADGVVFHTLRHTFASWLVMKGVDLYIVSRLLGNSLKMVEDTYAHLAPDYRQRAVDRLAGVVAIPQLPTDDGPKAPQTPKGARMAT